MTLSKSFLFILVLISLGSCAQNDKNSEMHQYTNDLIHETSPYLLQHAHNPVDWHAWNAENLKEAQELNKPILISIGYSSCHWCHVMEHESFEDAEVAKYMNEHFYCIKVDREERPDVDQIYMTAANIITGNGGWPLNCFAMPDGRPFHAGTYYPKNDWLKLLQTVDLQFTRNRSKLEDYASRLTQGIRLQETAISDNLASPLNYDALISAVNEWKSQWDMEEGGMNRAPKFPMPSNYNFLLDYNHFESDQVVDDFIQLSLQKMAFGGIYDQVGGGFARYSTDKLWKAPHFEKMLYDNGQLLSLYSKAYRKYKNPLYQEVIDQTVNWLKNEMLDESGLFYSALDADSEGEEGKFYVWKANEFGLLGEDEELIKAFYEVNKKGLWEHGNNILLRKKSYSEIAEQFGVDESDVREKVKRANKLLYEERSKRVHPSLDDKCLTSWNGLVITGLAEAFKTTNNKDYKVLAINCLNALIKSQVRDDHLLHSYKSGISSIDGMLEDYCFMAEACLSVFEITGDETYAEQAKQITEMAIELFYDADKEMFYFNVENELIIRTTEVYDNVIPSSNSAMAHVLYQVGLLYGNPRYLEISQTMIGKVQKNIGEYVGGHSNWGAAHLNYSKRNYEIAIAGKDAESVAQEIQQLALYNCWVTYSTKKSKLPLFEGRYQKGKTLIYVCESGACQLPVESLDEALKQIK